MGTTSEGRNGSKYISVSHRKNWYAGANPWSITQNQGIEGKNQAIKSLTLSRVVSIGRLFEITKTMLKEWSEQDDSILFKDRLSLLDGKDGLKLKTNGWIWSQKQKNKSVIKLPGSHKQARHTTSEAAGLGKPSRLEAPNHLVSQSGIRIRHRHQFPGVVLLSV